MRRAIVARTAVLALLVVAGALGWSPPARADGDELAARCRETGDHLACASAGAPLEAASPESAAELYKVACAKHPDQCWAFVAFGQRALRKRDAARAAQVLEQACALRSAQACLVLAAELEEGERGIVADAAKAARFYDRACELSAARACVVLAVMVEDGRGARRDPARAQRLRTRAEALDKPAPRGASPGDLAQNEAQCRKHRDAGRCLAAGAALQETDAVKAEELLRVGCAADKATCGLWGFAVDRFRRDDPTRGQRILDEGCAQGTALACEVLAELSHAGFRSIPRNEARAAELYEKACTLGDPAGCRVTASRFRGVRNAARADELRDRALALEAEADKAVVALHEKWIKDAPGVLAREGFLRELDRRRGEWGKLAARSRARWEVRMQRLAAIEAGNEAEPLSPAPASDAEGSAARGASIKRMSKALFP
jgi:TPR repeat protein